MWYCRDGDRGVIRGLHTFHSAEFSVSHGWFLLLSATLPSNAPECRLQSVLYFCLSLENQSIDLDCALTGNNLSPHLPQTASSFFIFIFYILVSFIFG